MIRCSQTATLLYLTLDNSAEHVPASDRRAGEFDKLLLDVSPPGCFCDGMACKQSIEKTADSMRKVRESLQLGALISGERIHRKWVLKLPI